MAESIFSIIIRARDQGATATLNSVGLALDQAGAKVRGLDLIQSRLAGSSQQALVGGAALAGVLGILGKNSMEANQELRNVNTIAKLDESALAGLKTRVLDIAKDPNVKSGFKELNTGLYDIYSNGFSGETALAMLHQSAILATGGVESAAGAVNTLMDVMSAYGKRSPEDAKRVADELYKSVEIGRFRLEGLKGQIGPAMAVAAQLKVPEKEVLAGLAVLTNAGFSTSEAGTAVAASIRAFLAPSKQMTKTAKEQGYESAVAALKAKGLAGAINLVSDAAKGNDTELAAMMGDVRSINGAMILGGTGAASFAKAIEDIGNSTGSAGAAADQVMKGDLSKWQKSMQELALVGQEVGDRLAPAITRIADTIRLLVDKWDELTPQQKQWAVDAAAATTAALLLGGGVGLVASKVLGVVKAFEELKALGSLGELLQGGSTAGEIAGAVAGAAGKSRGKKVADVAAIAGDVAGAVADVAGGGGRSKRAQQVDKVAEEIFHQFNPRAAAAPVARAAGDPLAALAAQLGRGAKWGERKVVNDKGILGELLGLLGKGGAAATTSGTIVAGAEGAGGAAAAGAGGAGALATLGPIALVVAALTGLAVEAWYLNKSWKTAREAMDQAKVKKQETLDAENAAAKTGTWNFDSVARGMGYNEKDITRLNNSDASDPEFKRISDEVMRRNRRNAPQHTADRKMRDAQAASMGNQAISDANLAAYQAQYVDGVWQDPSLSPAAQFAAIPSTAFSGASASGRSVKADDKYGRVLTQNFYGSTLEQMQAASKTEIERQFGPVPA